MIQRIQSILLLLSACVLSISLFTPVWTASSNGTSYDLDAYQISISHETTSTSNPTYFAAILLGISIALTLFVIFKYNNRVLQMRLNMMNTLLICMVEGLFFWNIRETKLLIGSAEFTEHFGVAFYMPLVALMLCFYAGKRIQKDENLVRSVDRLR
ncbi:DUF4293 domain-containing protein [uncultured Cytophaga sp.]|uniref:DUF4293 domain-containing protein n=1 Tax=uncultured Cytophaga sp. TaxID=160238 RepID=UPI002618DE4A|nr:DUF4293 domain-containing protein [uncultured Cytophaga sp.]